MTHGRNTRVRHKKTWKFKIHSGILFSPPFSLPHLNSSLAMCVFLVNLYLPGKYTLNTLVLMNISWLWKTHVGNHLLLILTTKRNKSKCLLSWLLLPLVYIIFCAGVYLYCVCVYYLFDVCVYLCVFIYKCIYLYALIYVSQICHKAPLVGRMFCGKDQRFIKLILLIIILILIAILRLIELIVVQLLLLQLLQ